MSIYISIFIISGLFSLFELLTIRYKNTKLIRYNLFITIFLLLLFIAGFRTVGWDYLNYKYIYETISKSSNWIVSGLSQSVEIGYSFLNYISPSFEALLFFIAILSLWLFFLFFFRYSRLPLFSIAMFVAIIFMGCIMGQYRQALSVAIGLFAIVNRDEKIRFYVIVALATLIHSSALILLLAKFIPTQYKSRSLYIYALILAFVFNITLFPLYKIIISFLPPFLESKLLVYLYKETVPLGITITLMFRIFIFMFVYALRSYTKDIKLMPFFTNCYFCSIILYTALGFAPQIAGRGALYFAFLEVVIVANVIYSLRIKSNQVLIYGIFISFVTFRFIQFLNDANSQIFFPYSNWLF